MALTRMRQEHCPVFSHGRYSASLVRHLKPCTTPAKAGAHLGYGSRPSPGWRWKGATRLGLTVPPVRLAAFGEGFGAFDVILAVEIGLGGGIGRGHRLFQRRLVQPPVHLLPRGADRHR